MLWAIAIIVRALEVVQIERDMRTHVARALTNTGIPSIYAPRADHHYVCWHV